MGNQGPLSGLTVIEMTYYRAGPFCGTILADMGADVIKVEQPGQGDPNRGYGAGPDGRSGTFMALNRNKRSVTVDLKTDAGRKAMLELLAEADVFMENFSLGVVERLGIDYDSVEAVNDDLVYASVKGYGETGPYKDKKGVDLIMQAEGGIMSVTGPDGGHPVKVGQAIGDLSAGLFMTVGILGRLYEREQKRDADGADGNGEFVGKFDVGLFESVVRLMDEYITLYSLTGHVPGPQGTSHQTMVPYQMFDTADGKIVVGVTKDEHWDRFVDMLGCDDIREYRTNAERVEHREEVVDAIQDALEAESTEYWREKMTEQGFPNGPLNRIDDVVEHEQATARGVVQAYDDPEAGEVLLPGLPINFEGQSQEIPADSVPHLGEHNRDVFAAVAGDMETYERWRTRGAFGEE